MPTIRVPVRQPASPTQIQGQQPLQPPASIGAGALGLIGEIFGTLGERAQERQRSIEAQESRSEASRVRVDLIDATGEFQRNMGRLPDEQLTPQSISETFDRIFNSSVQSAPEDLREPLRAKLEPTAATRKQRLITLAQSEREKRLAIAFDNQSRQIIDSTTFATIAEDLDSLNDHLQVRLNEGLIDPEQAEKQRDKLITSGINRGLIDQPMDTIEFLIDDNLQGVVSGTTERAILRSAREAGRRFISSRVNNRLEQISRLVPDQDQSAIQHLENQLDQIQDVSRFLDFNSEVVNFSLGDQAADLRGRVRSAMANIAQQAQVRSIAESVESGRRIPFGRLDEEVILAGELSAREKVIPLLRSDALLQESLDELIKRGDLPETSREDPPASLVDQVNARKADLIVNEISNYELVVTPLAQEMRAMFDARDRSFDILARTYQRLKNEDNEIFLRRPTDQPGIVGERKSAERYTSVRNLFSDTEISQIETYLDLKRTLGGVRGNAELADLSKQIHDESDPETQQLALLRSDLSEFRKNNVEAFAKEVDTPFILESTIRDMVPPQMRSDLDGLVQAVFQLNGGKLERARRTASNLIRSTWRRSAFNNGEFMKFAPEAVYGTGKQTEWMVNDFKAFFRERAIGRGEDIGAGELDEILENIRLQPIIATNGEIEYLVHQVDTETGIPTVLTQFEETWRPNLERSADFVAHRSEFGVSDPLSRALDQLSKDLDERLDQQLIDDIKRLQEDFDMNGDESP